MDRFHVLQHLHQVSEAIYGPRSPQAPLWAQRRQHGLKSGPLSDLLRALRHHADCCEEARKCLQYIHRNLERMQYPASEAMGPCTSTGVFEAGCKIAIGSHLKRVGMYRTVAGANAIIALHCCHLSGRFQDFYGRHTEQSKAA